MREEVQCGHWRIEGLRAESSLAKVREKAVGLVVLPGAFVCYDLAVLRPLSKENMAVCEGNQKGIGMRKRAYLLMVVVCGIVGAEPIRLHPKKQHNLCMMESPLYL